MSGKAPRKPRSAASTQYNNEKSKERRAKIKKEAAEKAELERQKQEKQREQGRLRQQKCRDKKKKKADSVAPLQPSTQPAPGTAFAALPSSLAPADSAPLFAPMSSQEQALTTAAIRSPQFRERLLSSMTPEQQMAVFARVQHAEGVLRTRRATAEANERSGHEAEARLDSIWRPLYEPENGSSKQQQSQQLEEESKSDGSAKRVDGGDETGTRNSAEEAGSTKSNEGEIGSV